MENTVGMKFAENLRNHDDPETPKEKEQPKQGFFVIATRVGSNKSSLNKPEKNEEVSLGTDREQPGSSSPDDKVQIRNHAREERIQSANLYSLNARELLIYFLDRFHHQHGYPYKTDWDREQGVFTGFKKRYGTDSGSIVAHVFDIHHGYYSDEIITVGNFSVPCKWMQDKWYFEVQGRKQSTRVVSTAEGLLTGNEFLSLDQ